MDTAHDPLPTQQYRLGPVRVVEVFTSSPPPEVSISDSISNDVVPFDQIRNLISDKPLTRAMPVDPTP